MENVRIYGSEPYKVALIHGGPGAPGGMAPVANGLKENFGIIEPLQSSDSISGQLDELYNQLKDFAPPFVLIGHSWGAWLVWMFAAKYPKMVRHIILVGSGPFDEKYTKDMMKTRLQNLCEEERMKINVLMRKLNTEKLTEKEFSAFGSLMSKTDTYCEADSLYKEDPLPAQPHIYESVWPEAAELRKSGKLLEMANKIKCKITFIHGKNDPHPFEGVQDVLNDYGVDFEFILMDKCGHTPWKEKYRAEVFFNLLKKLIEE